MQKHSFYIIYAGVALALLGMMHFLLLLLPAPFPVIAAISFATIIGAFAWFRKTEHNIVIVSTLSFASGVLLLLALMYVAVKGANEAETTGGWDAWAIWNYAARYLDMPGQWKRHFLTIFNAHSDYPLNQPSVISFFWKLCGHEYKTVPFVYSLLMTLFIPALLFFELYRKGATIAFLALFMVVANSYYVNKGLWQYADTTVAFYFLCLLVCLYHAQKSQKPTWAALSAFMMACCIWTKNEGLLIALVTVVFYSSTILRKQNIVPFFLTLIVALIPWLILKFHFAPVNDLVEGQKDQSFARAFDLGRHYIVAKYFAMKLWQEQKMLLFMFLFYCAVCVYKRQMPSRQVLVIICIIAGTWFVYIFTPRSLEWHVSVTIDRMLQVWMPATLFAIFTDLFRDKNEKASIDLYTNSGVTEIS